MSFGGNLSENEIEKYSRHLILSGWSLGLQEFIKSTSILIEKDSHCLEKYLLAAGIEKISKRDLNSQQLLPFCIINTDQKDLDTKDCIISVKIDPSQSSVEVFIPFNTNIQRYKLNNSSNSLAHIMSLETLACSLFLKNLKDYYHRIKG